jgi:hypothetical protein
MRLAVNLMWTPPTYEVGVVEIDGYEYAARRHGDVVEYNRPSLTTGAPAWYLARHPKTVGSFRLVEGAS